MYKTIIFDFDGVITDGIPFHDKAYLAVLKDYGIDISLNYLHSKIGLTPKEVLRDILQENRNSADVNKLLKQHHDAMYNLYEAEATSSPNLNEFLVRCQQHGFHIGLASSTSSDILHMVLKKFEVEKYFNVVIGGETVTKGKPDPEMIQRALAKIKINSHQAIAIDDVQSGIDAAKSINMYTIAYVQYSKKEHINADMIVDDFLDVDFKKLK